MKRDADNPLLLNTPAKSIISINHILILINRYNRLKKQYAPIIPASILTSKQRPLTSRTARLEKRLEELVTLLRVQQESGTGKSQNEDENGNTNGENKENAENSEAKEPLYSITDHILTPAPSNNGKNIASGTTNIPSSTWSFTDKTTLSGSEN